MVNPLTAKTEILNDLNWCSRCRESDESFGLFQQICRGILYAVILIYLFVGVSGNRKTEKCRVKIALFDRNCKVKGKKHILLSQLHSVM